MKTIIYPIDYNVTSNLFSEISDKIKSGDIVVLPLNLEKCDKSTLNKLYDILYFHKLKFTVHYDEYPGTNKIIKNGYSVFKLAKFDFEFHSYDWNEMF